MGILLARQAMTLDQAVAALTVTSISGGGAAEEQERFVGETRQLVRRLLRYARMSQ
jgi:hypothetical protein